MRNPRQFTHPLALELKGTSEPNAKGTAVLRIQAVDPACGAGNQDHNPPSPVWAM